MPLLNYTTRVPAEKTVAEIMKTLVGGGARQIVTVYDDEGMLSGLRWSIESRHGPLSYALPCNIDAVFAILTEDRILVRDCGYPGSLEHQHIHSTSSSPLRVELDVAGVNHQPLEVRLINDRIEKVFR